QHHFGVHRRRVHHRGRPHLPLPASSIGGELMTRTRLDIARYLTVALVIAIVIVQVYPLVWHFITSLRPAQDFASGNPFGLPSSLTLENYVRAFEMADLLRFILNSFIVTAASSALIVLLGMMGAYALQVLGFRGSKVVFGLFLVG